MFIEMKIFIKVIVLEDYNLIEIYIYIFYISYTLTTISQKS